LAKLEDYFGGGLDEIARRVLRDQHVANEAERIRQSKASDRIALYKDDADNLVSDLADKIFRNVKVRRWRKAFIEIALFQNITRRVVREVSAVYSEEATRRISSGQEVYDELVRSIRQDRQMRKLNRYVTLCNESLLMFDVSEYSGMPNLRVLPPSQFWAIVHPYEPTMPIAFVVRQSPVVANPTPDMAHYMVIDGESHFKLNGRCEVIDGSRKPHGLSRIPAILVHRDEPDEGQVFDQSTGKDLIAAHLSLALINTMLLKQQKAGTKQAVAQGDMAEMASDQPMDEEHLLQVPDGVSVSVLDMGADPSNYIEAARFVIKQVAANWGMPESVFDLSYQATSGFEIELKRTALREVRRDQMLDYRPIEVELARLQAEVLQKARHPLAFSADGWRIDFGDVETPIDPMSKLAYWEKLRQMGLKNTLEMYMELNPEASEEDAYAALIENARVESVRVELLRALNIAPSATPDEPGSAPEQNGEGREAMQ